MKVLILSPNYGGKPFNNTKLESLYWKEDVAWLVFIWHCNRAAFYNAPGYNMDNYSGGYIVK